MDCLRRTKNQAHHQKPIKTNPRNPILILKLPVTSLVLLYRKIWAPVAAKGFPGGFSGNCRLSYTYPEAQPFIFVSIHSFLMRKRFSVSARALRVLLLALMVGISAWFYMDYGRKSVLLYGDDMGYYVYLPSAFIYHNLDSINTIPENEDMNGSTRWYLGAMAGQWTTPNGHVLVQYTYGVAAMEAPFFLAAHVWEQLTGGRPNGFAPSYMLAIRLATLFYGALGLWLLYRVLRRYFGPNGSLAGVAGIFLGSNLFWFTLHQAGMAHVPLFFLYALLMYLTIRLYEKPGWFLFAAIAFVAGFITLLRPTDIICLIIPLLYGVYRKEHLRQRLLFLKKHWRAIALMLPVFALPLLPQALYWKALSGSYFYDSYGEGQQFFWTHPKIIEGLFYFQNGWLAYSPLLIFSVLGLVLYRAYRPWNWIIWILFPVYVYITYCWYCYNYINGLGSRPMIHLYPLLALPFTAFVRFLFTRRSRLLRAAVAVITLFFISLNISWSVQQSLGLLLSEESSLAYNYSILFKTRIHYTDLVVRDTRTLQPDTAKLEKVATLGLLNFDAPGENHIPDTITGSGHLLYFPENEYWDEAIRVVYSKAAFGDARWLRGSGWFMIFQWPGYYKPELNMQFKRGEQAYREQVCRISNKMDIPAPGRDTGENRLRLERFVFHKWSPVSFFVDLPKDIREGDSIILSIHNTAKQPLLADDLKLELFRER